MASEDSSNVFPPITYSTAYNLRDEIREVTMILVISLDNIRLQIFLRK